MTKDDDAVDRDANISKYYYAYRLADEELGHRGAELDALEATGKGD